MASTRAADVAEILWELKRADKVGTYTVIARRAGFSAGSNGRAMSVALRTVRRDWPHLQWWRAIKDDRLLEKGSEQEEKLIESGFELEQVGEEASTISAIDEHLMNWEEEGSESTLTEEVPPGS